MDEVVEERSVRGDHPPADAAQTGPVALPDKDGVVVAEWVRVAEERLWSVCVFEDDEADVESLAAGELRECGGDGGLAHTALADDDDDVGSPAEVAKVHGSPTLSTVDCFGPCDQGSCGKAPCQGKEPAVASAQSPA